MDRRDALKTLGLAAAGSVAATAAASEAEAQTLVTAPGAFATPRDPADPLDPFLTNVVAIPDDYFIPGRFAGKTVIVTGTTAEGAVIYTASAAALRKLLVVVPVDGFSSGSPFGELLTAWQLVNAPVSVSRNVTLTRSDMITLR